MHNIAPANTLMSLHVLSEAILRQTCTFSRWEVKKNKNVLNKCYCDHFDHYLRKISPHVVRPITFDSFKYFWIQCIFNLRNKKSSIYLFFNTTIVSATLWNARIRARQTIVNLYDLRFVCDTVVWSSSLRGKIDYR